MKDQVMMRYLIDIVCIPGFFLGHSTVVAANMFVRNIESVDTKNMDFTVDITFRSLRL